jgi:hypothetical protein
MEGVSMECTLQDEAEAKHGPRDADAVAIRSWQSLSFPAWSDAHEGKLRYRASSRETSDIIPFLWRRLGRRL